MSESTTLRYLFFGYFFVFFTALVGPALVGCTEDRPTTYIKEAKPSEKEDKILFQVQHFLGSEYEVLGYEVIDRNYTQAVEIKLRTKDQGRTMDIRLEWEM